MCLRSEIAFSKRIYCKQTEKRASRENNRGNMPLVLMTTKSKNQNTLRPILKRAVYYNLNEQQIKITKLMINKKHTQSATTIDTYVENYEQKRARQPLTIIILPNQNGHKKNKREKH